MKLSDNQKRMLDGEQGKGLRKAMEILMAYGSCYNAERLIPVTSVHIAGNFPVLMDEGIEWLEMLAEDNIRVRVFTTKNPEMYDPEQADEMNIPQNIREKQGRIHDVLKKLGVTLTYSCQHYLVGNLPRFGDHIAWASSGSQVFANSVIGARSNRDGDHVALTSAITGVIPDWGLHITENRKANLIIDVSDLDIKSYVPADFKALGWSLGKQVGDRIPVFINLPPDLHIENIKGLLYTMTVTGAPGMVHLAGITPEAQTLEDALEKSKNKTRVILPSQAEVNRAFGDISSSTQDKIDMVLFGCPQCSIQEVQEIAELLEGRQINKNTRLWICTSGWVKMLCRRMGLLKILEKSGVRVVCDVGAADGPHLYLKNQGIKVIAVNSARASYYAHTLFGMETWFGSTKDCIASAISGRWEGKK